jgi:hypothetical protein
VVNEATTELFRHVRSDFLDTLRIGSFRVRMSMRTHCSTG